MDIHRRRIHLMNELFLVCYEQDDILSSAPTYFFFCTILEFHTQIHSHSTHKERKRVHNAFISLEYLVKIVRKLMQQMFECFDDFRQQKKAHIAHLCHRIPPCINTHTLKNVSQREIRFVLLVHTLPIGYSFY